MRELFESSIETLLADLVTPAFVRECEATVWPASAWVAIEEGGFCAAAAPETLGGSGASWLDLYPIVHGTGKHALPLPLPETMLANWLLGRAGIPSILGPASISSVGALTQRDGKVTGHVIQVPWGRHVNHVVAITRDAAPQVVVLDRASASSVNAALNAAREPRDDLHFLDVAPIVQAPLPPHLPEDVLRRGAATMRSAQIAGALERILDLSMGYAAERKQFGRPIAAFQAIQHQLALLAEHVSAATVAAEEALASLDRDLDVLPVAAAKICAGEAASAGAAIGHAVLGAIGFTYEHSLHLYTRRLWSWRSEFGSQTAWAQDLGRAICESGDRRLWPILTGTERLGAADTSRGGGID